jgi:hypothetical protein
MYLGAWQIDDYLTFPCNSHAAATGAATDGDGVPTYRIYEDETGTAILTGSMAKLDDANTTGFYTERIQLTAANGFEVGKTYTVYYTVTVSSVAGTGSHTFKMEAAGLALTSVIEGSYDLQDVLKILLAPIAGKASGGGTATITYRDTGDSTDRVVATVDANGNRSAVVITV